MDWKNYKVTSPLALKAFARRRELGRALDQSQARERARRQARKRARLEAFERGFEEGLELGREENRTAVRSFLNRVLDRRGLKPTAGQRKAIAACQDLTRLHKWAERAMTASTVAEALEA